MTLNNNISYRHLQAGRTVFCHAFFTLFIILATLAPLKAMADPYIVEGVEVDVTADNAVEAREKAFEEAQIKGYEMLAQRFLSPEELENFEAPDINIVSALVKDYEVTNEQLSAVRYKGVYKIRYSSKAFSNRSLQNLPQNQSQETAVPAQQARGEILILPFREIGGRTYLWQANPFLEAWVRARNNNQAMRAIIPVGDIEDISQIHEDQALTYNPERLNAMRLRYQAKEVALMVARPEPMTDGTTNIVVSIYNAKPYGPELVRGLSVTGYEGEVEDQLYNRVVTEVSQAIGVEAGAQATASAKTAAPATMPPLSGPVSDITAQLNFTSVREWVDSKRAVERARGVQSLQVKSLSPRSATVTISFQGDVQTLRTSLQNVGLRLNDPQTQQNTATGDRDFIYQLSSGRSRR